MIAPHPHAPRTTAAVRLWMPVLLSLFVQIPPVFFDYGATRSNLVLTSKTGGELLFAFGLAVVGPLALIGARRFPGLVVAVVAVAASADLLLADGVDGPPYIAFAFAIGSAIVRGARVWAWASIALSWSGSLALAAFFGIEWQPWRIAGITIVILVIVGMAEGIRTKRAHSVEAMREFVARQEAVVGAERVRIARELHDVLAHSLSQINVQASVGLHLMEKDHQKAAEALANIKESSKAALDEVRSVLGALRADSGESQGAPLVPEPQLSRLTALISPLSLQGIEVEIVDELSVPHHSARAAANTANTANTAHTAHTANTPHAAHTGPELPQAVQLAIFRIVQESLTNVARHSHASTVRVTLSRSEGDYFVQIVDNGTGSGGATGGVADSGGRGVLGMRERAELLGGTLQAGVNPAGGFEVIARIPERVAAS